MKQCTSREDLIRSDRAVRITCKDRSQGYTLFVCERMLPKCAHPYVQAEYTIRSCLGRPWCIGLKGTAIARLFGASEQAIPF